MKAPAVYILASQCNGTLYIGVTSNLTQRIWQHREGLADGFTKQYKVKTLVWYEQHATMESAISKEKAMKKWNRTCKLNLIEKDNPLWNDLWPEILGTDSATSALTSATSPSTPPNPSFPSPPRHSRVGGNPAPRSQIPAYAGMTKIWENCYEAWLENKDYQRSNCKN